MRYYGTKKVKVYSVQDKVWFYGVIVKFYEYKKNGIRIIKPDKNSSYFLNQFQAWEVVEN